MAKTIYGLVSDLRLREMGEGDLILMTGGALKPPEFEHFLTRQASHFLWYFLTRSLFPDQGKSLSAEAAGVPLILPDAPYITTHIGVVDLPGGEYEIIGTLRSGAAWEMLVTAADARQLWGALDVLLYPMGWQGRETQSP
jgi:hypothetical protein